MAYERIDWENEPSVDTPLNEDNLNHMEDGIVANEEAIGDLSTEVEGKQDALTFDNTPTANSSNPVTSGGIKTALDTKLNKNNPSATGAIQLGTGAQASSQYGMDSIAIGTDAYAIDMNSTAIGHGAKASVPEQVVLGDHNVTDTTSKLILGGGSDDNDKRTLLKFEDSTGDATFCAEVTDGSGNKLSNKIETSDVQNLIESILPTDSASGNPCVITDAFNTNAKSVKLTLNPIQSGSGTPSPSNVRPISGRTQSVVTRTGKNLVNPSTGSFTSVASWVSLENVNANTVTNGTPIYLPEGTYTLSYAERTTAWTTQIFGADGSTILNSSQNSVTFTVSADTLAYIRINVGYQQAVSFKIQIEVGSTTTPYEPYNGEFITRTYGTTIYGGSDDVTGDGVTNKYAVMGASDFESFITSPSAGGLQYAEANSTGAKLDGLGLCNMADVDNYGAWGATIPTAQISYVTEGKIRFYCECTSRQEFLTTYANLQIVYELKTPTSIPLTAQNITLLHGDNVLTTDADSIEASYSADIALYIAKKIAEGISQGNRSLSKGGSSEPEEETEEVKKEEIKEEEVKEEIKEEETKEEK